MLITSEYNCAGNFHSLFFSFVHSLPIYFYCCHIANICSQEKRTVFANFPLFPFIKCPTTLSLFITATAYLSTALSGSIWHCKSKQPSKKMLFEAIDLSENFALFQNNDIAKQLRKHTAQVNQLLTSSSRKKQSMIPSYFTRVTEE